MLFEPFRSLGYVSGRTPLSIQARGQAYFLTASIDNSFTILNGQNMTLMIVGEDSPGDINAITSHQDLTFCAVQQSIYIYQRQKIVNSIECPAIIESLMILGDLVIASSDSSIYFYNFKTDTYVNEISTGNFIVTSIIHPSTYVNKILLASHEGTMQLWNFQSMTLLYEFKSLGAPITCMVQSPSIDVIAIGLVDGSTVLYNIKLDRELLRFRQEGKVTAISFRTDGIMVMATANSNGDVALWDLNERRLIHLMTGCHDAEIHTCFFYHGSTILLTASADNSIKQWVFDSGDGTPRLLKSRSGHHKPPTIVKHYGSTGTSLITSGMDQSLRFLSIIRDSQNTELSQGKLESKARKSNVHIDSLRLPNIIQFDANDAKQGEWDNVLTCHSSDKVARTFNFQRKAIGKHSLVSKDGSNVKATRISACGNFGFIGSALGQIDKFNMQSGIFRNSFVGHTKQVTAIVTDNVNLTVISSSLDGSIKFWDFSKTTLLNCIEIGSAISSIILHDNSRLLAAVCDDMIIRIIDIDTFTIVRKFEGHSNRITDITFTSDGRWLISASIDTTIRTWDLPTGFCIDAFKLPEICTALSMSPTGDFLATTHVNRVGVYLWSNKSQYTMVPLKKVSDVELRTIMLPSANGLVVNDLDHDSGMEEDQIDLLANWPEVEDDLITMSSLPKSRWHNLLNLDSIKERNKPKEAPKVAEKAPFFLPVLQGALPTFVAPNTLPTTKVMNMNLHSSESVLNSLLHESKASGSSKAIFEHLKALMPSAVDLEIRTLPQSVDEATLFLQAISQAIESKQDFELIMSYLHVFLRIHGDLVQEVDQVLVSRLKDSVKGSWSRLESKLLYGLCLVEFSLQ